MTLFDTIKKWIDNSLFINFMIETLGGLIMFGVVLGVIIKQLQNVKNCVIARFDAVKSWQSSLSRQA